MNKKILSLTVLGLLAATLLLACITPAWAQSEALHLSRSKNAGFSSGNQMQGRFTFTVSGPQDLTSATLLMDGQALSTLNQPPFRFTLDTGQYAQGPHVMSATALAADGSTLASEEVHVKFLSTAQAWEATQRIIVPLVVVILLAAVAGTLGSTWLANRRPGGGAGPRRSYGAAGGAICSRCGRPFPLSVMQLNMLTGKLARCPHCGKWQIARRARPEALAAAETTEAADARPAVPEESDEEKLRRQIEESRYQ